MEKTHLLKTIVCPKCGRKLTNLYLYDGVDYFQCDSCNIDITVENHAINSNNKNLFVY